MVGRTRYDQRLAQILEIYPRPLRRSSNSRRLLLLVALVRAIGLGRPVRETTLALPAAPVSLALLPVPVRAAGAARDAGGLVGVGIARGPARLLLLLLHLRHGGGRGHHRGCGGRHFRGAFSCDPWG